METQLGLQQIISRIADERECDVRTVIKVMSGIPVRGRVGLRIARALTELGVEIPTPQTEAKAA